MREREREREIEIERDTCIMESVRKRKQREKRVTECKDKLIKAVLSFN